MRAYYLAIEPPAHELGRLSSLLRRLGDPSPLPHVTVVAPPELGTELSWLAAVQEVAAQSGPVAISIGEPRAFGDRVLYLSIDSSTIAELRHALLAAIGRDGQGPTTHDDEPYVPHLTIAVARRGRRLPDLQRVRSLLFDVAPFDARELTLFRRDGPAQSYRAWQHFAFANR